MKLEQATKLLGADNVQQYLDETRRIRRLLWALQAAHDSLLMDPSGRGRATRGFRVAAAVLEGKITDDPADPANEGN